MSFTSPWSNESWATLVEQLKSKLRQVALQVSGRINQDFLDRGFGKLSASEFLDNSWAELQAAIDELVEFETAYREFVERESEFPEGVPFSETHLRRLQCAVEELVEVYSSEVHRRAYRLALTQEQIAGQGTRVLAEKMQKVARHFAFRATAYVDGTGTESGAQKGVSMRDLQLELTECERTSIKEVKRAIDGKKFLARPIGKCPRDGRARLYKLSEIVGFAKKVYGLSADEKHELTKALRKRLRYPRT